MIDLPIMRNHQSPPPSPPPDSIFKRDALAACFVSVGQLAQFAAIKYIEVSRVVVITSTEIFISIFLSVYVLKTECRPDLATLAAAVLASIGVALVALR